MASRLQRLKTRWAESWRSGVWGALIAAIAGLCFLLVQVGNGRALGENLVLLSYDIPLKLRPSVQSSKAAFEAVIVYMDEDSHTLLNPRTGAEWHRSLHTRLLQRLRDLGATAVVFDVLMDRPWTQLAPNEPPAQAAQVDEQLAAAIRQHGKIVLAGMVEVLNEPAPKVTAHFPIEPLLSAAAGWGTVEFDVDPDRRIRRVAYSDLSNVPPPLSWKTMEVLGRSVPASRFQTRWLNFYGPARTIGWKSYYQVLSNDVPAEFFAGKVVFVGGAPVIGPQGVVGDLRPTPLGELPGVEIQATAFLNLWRQEWLRELSPWRQVGLISLLGLVFGFSFCLVRPGIAAVLTVVAFLLIGTVAVEMVWLRLTWFPWMITGAVQLPVALGWAVLSNTRRVYREKAALEKSLATALRTPVPAAGAAPAAKGETRTVAMAGPAAPQSPAVLGDHELVRVIGQGAYGEVWLARNVIGLYRAVKIIRRDKFKDDLPFQREFRGLEKFMPVSMGHPGFVKVLHIGKNEAEGFFFYIMEPADDELTGQKIDPGRYTPKNLAREYHKRGALPVLEAIDIVVPLCDALDHLHRQGLVHRDVKPSNIIFVEGVPKLADIGLVTDIARRSHDVTWVGTEGYIPPEGPGSAGADLYSLGKLLYEIALGMDPRSWPAFPTTLVQGPQQAEVLALDEVLLKACTNPQDRYTSAAEFRNALQRLRTQIAREGPTRT
jgi:CHASE2 domain-containing sensor protein